VDDIGCQVCHCDIGDRACHSVAKDVYDPVDIVTQLTGEFSKKFLRVGSIWRVEKEISKIWCQTKLPRNCKFFHLPEFSAKFPRNLTCTPTVWIGSSVTEIPVVSISEIFSKFPAEILELSRDKRSDRNLLVDSKVSSINGFSVQMILQVEFFNLKNFKPDGETRSWEGLSPDEMFGQSQIGSQNSNLVLVIVTKGFDDTSLDS
jgi:hypothetical protein